jgi:hypothetical protein
MRLTVSIFVLLAGVVASFSGCQCCAVTEHYASLIDCISDQEHAMERFYHPCWDLNRIGRSDWCSCPINRHLCPCVCSRIRPAPCGYVVCRETGLVLKDRISRPDWAQPAEGGDDSESAPLPPGAGAESAPPADGARDILPLLDVERAEQDLQLP